MVYYVHCNQQTTGIQFTYAVFVMCTQTFLTVFYVINMPKKTVATVDCQSAIMLNTLRKTEEHSRT